MWPLTAVLPLPGGVGCGCGGVGWGCGGGDGVGPVTRKLRLPFLSTVTLAVAAGGFVITSQACPVLAQSASYTPAGRAREYVPAASVTAVCRPQVPQDPRSAASLKATVTSATGVAEPVAALPV